MGNSVEFRISNLGARVASTKDALPFAVADGDSVIIRCPPGSGNSPSEKLVWLWGMLNSKRRMLKSLQANGAEFVCVCTAPHGDVVLQPNAVQFLHLVGVPLVISARGA